MGLLALAPYMVGILVVLFVVVSVMMMLVVLIQRPSGGGLSGAFGAASEGAGQTAFGARTGDALTTATIVIFLIFLLFAVGLNYAVKPIPAQADNQATSGDPAGAVVPPATGEGAGDAATTPIDVGGTPAPAATDEAEPAAEEEADTPIPADDPPSESPE